MTKDDLLKPRFKVISDWPGNQWLIGTILSKHSKAEYWFCVNDDIFNGMRGEGLDKHPHLFKRLHWSEDRPVEDLPQYIKFFSPLPERYKFGKVEKWEIRNNDKLPVVKTDLDIVRRELSPYDLPATPAEYDSYINKKLT